MSTTVTRFRFYAGRPVKRMRRGQHGIILTFVSAISGESGEQITISQADWNMKGEWRDVAAVKMDDIRKLVVNQSN